jgi:hypothetical protein
MKKKDIKTDIWRNAFNDLDENGDIIPTSKKIKTDSDINRGRSNRLKAKDPEFQKKRMEGWSKVINSEEWRKSAKERGEERKSNLKLKKQQSEWINNLNKDEELKKIRHNSIRETWSKEEKRLDHSNVMKELYKKNPEIAKKRANKRKIPLISDQGEIFSYRGEAAEYYSTIWNMKPSSASCKILKLIRDDNSDWRYISQEEYIMLTGKDI